MDEESSNSPKRRYRWPWIVAVALILWVLLAFVWVYADARHVEEQRDFSAPSSVNQPH